MSRYIVVGAGAVGGLLAAQWTLAQVPVVLVAREPAHTAIVRDGLRVRRPHGEEVVPMEVTGSITDARPTGADTIVLAVKAQDAERTVAAIAWVPLSDGRGVVADLPILTVQNGLAAERIALRRFDTVIGVSVGVPASHLEPGVIVSAAHPIVGAAWLGGYPRSLPAEEERHRLALAAAGFAASVEPDIAAAKRRKLIANLRTVIDVFDATREEAEDAEAALADEARAVFAAAGLAVAPPPRDGARLQVGEVPGHEPGRGSTWQSFARGASSEVDYLSGEVALAARSAGVAAPLNAAVARALGVLAQRRGGPGELPLPVEFGFELVGGAAERSRR
ncbi:2-dehydropantoate 2-reductase N-terminal domain-containing protein [Microbacterium sp. zg-YB36]|uniref:ketopantoate reductase family protein n=1 Tax=Microbacterium sp. zg-YB36 TaxID=2969407 RepID=UPI00214C6D38|nr:2-dehydropantoate 2-reductase N-terminal domain-containing protein [Microbacterium sp. zg-YB36]MDL5351628.1 2-dehydropantoate 2-reductase N-terminal domain-containing protein [Microbacterium sp. zg-YB36]